ncbi:MAG: restriction endonuclease [Alphaproteobacteria bacterium]|nr:restriction endonuclease [Alphaproteobacteria bacterium]
MSNYEIGKSYEDFVEMVYQALLEAERRNGQIGHVLIERRKKIVSKSGTPAEIDIYWEYEIAGIKNCVAIECRNYNKNVDIPGVRDFARKISDISGLKGLMVTQKGFSVNAIAEAKSDNIDLLIVRKQEPMDWDGRIKNVAIRIHILNVAKTLNIEPTFDQDWLAKNGYKKGDTLSFSVNNDVLIFEDKADGFRHSLLDLENNHFFEQKGDGEHTWSRAFQDGWAFFDQKPFKINFLKIAYLNPPVSQQEINIDFENYVLAIMEYVSGGAGKYVVLKSGEKKEF